MSDPIIDQLTGVQLSIVHVQRNKETDKYQKQLSWLINQAPRYGAALAFLVGESPDSCQEDPKCDQTTLPFWQVADDVVDGDDVDVDVLDGDDVDVDVVDDDGDHHHYHLGGNNLFSGREREGGGEQCTLQEGR